MSSSRVDRPVADHHPLLQDLLPRDEVQVARIDEVTERTRDDAVLVHRRAIPVLTTRLPESLPAWAAGLKVERVIGPIRDQFGRDTFFDIFRRVRQVRFVRAAGGAPFLAVPMSQLSIAVLASSTSVNLSAGSFWIATKLLAAAAGDGVYTGLRIAGGQLHFDQPVSFAGDEVVVPAEISCRVELELAPPPPPGGTGPGRDVRESLFQPPRNVTIAIAATIATVTVRDACALRIYGQDVGLDPTAGVATYLPLFNRVKVPLAPTVADFTVGVVHSTTLRPEGSAPITGGGWALPAAVIAPADLGEASGVGALMLELDAGLSATWTGRTEAVPLGPTLLFLDEARLATASAFARAYDVAQHPELPKTTGRGRLALTWNHVFPLTYFAQANGSEAVFTVARFRASLETPVDVNGDRVSVDAPAASVIFIENADGRFLWVAGEVPLSSTNRGLAFSLTNAVLRASLPISYSLLARYDGVVATEGILSLGYVLAGIIPSLPDPYATNAVAARERGFGRLISLSWWNPTKAGLDFLLPSAPDLPLRQLDATPDEAVGMVHASPADRGWLNIFRFFGSRAFRVEEELGPADRAIGDTLTFESVPRLILLDLSTNISQFGVALRASREHLTSQREPVKPAAIQDLNLVVDGRFLTLLTLPAVQWEPASGEPVVETPPFPPGVRFAKNGVPSLVDVPTVNLMPVTPDAALTAIVDNFADPNPRPARARFTLPFGMIANATLQKPGPGRGARVSEKRPTSLDGLQNGRHLRIDADDPSLAKGRTPALPGFTVQLPNATPTDGSPGPRSILGTSVTNIFNNYLGAGPSASATHLVPVTRVDLSGYGESLFSGWQNPEDDETQVAKAEFKVLTGRTAHEVVQVRSILLPYYVRVVRTITLERKNNAAITRHDSGWVAVDDGAYRFPAASGIVTHPGVVKRITNVTHIRETGDRVTKNGIEFIGVYYQGDVVLDGAAKPVPVTHHFGYVKVGVTNLTPAPYAALLADAGPLCGPLDTTIRIGGGPQAMRLHRIGVGVTQVGTTPQFVMTAWGALVFPGGGEWSVLQATDAAGAPQPVPKDEGLPLIRRGATPAGPYRFADPSDLERESTPARDYGILHSTGTQRAFFRRPKIDADLSRIVSNPDVRPVIADPYVMATALGPFPKQSDAIPFPAAPWALVVDGGGNYRLDIPPSFPAGIGRRTMRQTASVKRDLDYSASIVTYQIDTSQPVPWRFSLTKAASIMSNTAMGDVIKLTSNVVAEAGREMVLDEPLMELGDALDFVKDMINVLEKLGIAGIFRTVMTNEWKLTATLTIPFVDATGHDIQVPLWPAPNPTIKFADTGIVIKVDVAPGNQGASFEIQGRPMFAVQAFPGLYVVAIIGFKIELTTESGTRYTLLLGVGVAYEIEAGPFELKGLLAITFFAVFGDDICGYGVGFLVKVSAAIEPIISIELTLEGKLARVEIGPANDPTVFCAAKLVFAIEVSIFLVFSIDIEVEAKQVTKVSGPLLESACPDITN